MEAMSQGKPVIVTNYGGLPEIVENGKTGFVCKPFNSNDLKKSIKKVCALSQDEYKAMSTRAVQKAKIEFSPETYAQRLTDYYIKLIGSKKQK